MKNMLRCLLRKPVDKAPTSFFLNQNFTGARGSNSFSQRFKAVAKKSVRDFVKAVSVPVTSSSKSNVTSHDAIVVNNIERKTNFISKHVWVHSPSTESDRMVSCYKKLAKFRLTSLVVITAMGGYAMAPACFDLYTFAMCSVGTGLLSAAANAVNQYHEVPFDSQMSRTKNRVLVTGKITPMNAIGFTILSATGGLSALYYGVNGLTAALGLCNLVLYTCFYTPMKRISILNTWVGSVVGAIPPLMGWAGCTGELAVEAWIIAALLYSWQFPHFNALSWNLRPDYSRAGYRMMSVTNPLLCRRVAFKYTVVIAALSLVAPFIELTNEWFALETIPLNAYFIYLAYKFNRKSDSGSSRKLFRYSLLHLPVLMLLLILNKKRWTFLEAPKLESLAENVAVQAYRAERTNDFIPVSVFKPKTSL